MCAMIFFTLALVEASWNATFSLSSETTLRTSHGAAAVGIAGAASKKKVAEAFEACPCTGGLQANPVFELAGAKICSLGGSQCVDRLSIGEARTSDFRVSASGGRVRLLNCTEAELHGNRVLEGMPLVLPSCLLLAKACFTVRPSCETNSIGIGRCPLLVSHGTSSWFDDANSNPAPRLGVRALPCADDSVGLGLGNSLASRPCRRAVSFSQWAVLGGRYSSPCFACSRESVPR
mmetsp:Transcript_13210/g.32961  ORF Transcript_13210/g.32961 Transcript_13210/m.32961 type:complete len:234 (-) Transcript_13210:2238-2939(-)